VGSSLGERGDSSLRPKDQKKEKDSPNQSERLAKGEEVSEFQKKGADKGMIVEKISSTPLCVTKVGTLLRRGRSASSTTGEEEGGNLC